MQGCWCFNRCISWTANSLSKCSQLTSFLEVLLWRCYVHLTWLNWFYLTGALVVLIGCMIFLSSFLDVIRMSLSTISFLTQPDSVSLIPECFSLAYDLNGFNSSVNKHFSVVGFSLNSFHIVLSIFFCSFSWTPCFVVAAQSCMEWISIKNEKYLCSSITRILQKPNLDSGIEEGGGRVLISREEGLKKQPKVNKPGCFAINRAKCKHTIFCQGAHIFSLFFLLVMNNMRVKKETNYRTNPMFW